MISCTINQPTWGVAQVSHGVGQTSAILCTCPSSNEWKFGSFQLQLFGWLSYSQADTHWFPVFTGLVFLGNLDETLVLTTDHRVPRSIFPPLQYPTCLKLGELHSVGSLRQSCRRDHPGHQYHVPCVKSQGYIDRCAVTRMLTQVHQYGICGLYNVGWWLMYICKQSCTTMYMHLQYTLSAILRMIYTK